MAKYRKKPAVIEAAHCSQLHWAAGNAWKDLPPWMVAAYDRGEVIFANHPSRILIKTLEGTMTADHGDMVICGVKGELYPCKADIFAATYEHVADEVAP
jgi:hypothetical protein